MSTNIECSCGMFGRGESRVVGILSQAGARLCDTMVWSGVKQGPNLTDTARSIVRRKQKANRSCNAIVGVVFSFCFPFFDSSLDLTVLLVKPVRIEEEPRVSQGEQEEGIRILAFFRVIEVVLVWLRLVAEEKDGRAKC